MNVLGEPLERLWTWLVYEALIIPDGSSPSASSSSSSSSSSSANSSGISDGDTGTAASGQLSIANIGHTATARNAQQTMKQLWNSSDIRKLVFGASATYMGWNLVKLLTILALRSNPFGRNRSKSSAKLFHKGKRLIVERTKDEACKEVELPSNTEHPIGQEMILKTPQKPGKLLAWDPATMQYIGEVEAMTGAQVQELITKAKKAQPEWAKTTFEQRREVIGLMLQYFVDEAESIARVSVRDSGKTFLGSMLGEIIPTVEKMRWMIANGERVLSPSFRGGHGIMTMHKSARVEYHPIGVLGVLAPANYPATNFMNHIISGLFAGNAVVVKVSEYTSWSSQYYLRIVREALKQATGAASQGYDENLVQLVTGFSDAGAALVSSPDIGKIIFTGSDTIGRHIMRAAADNLTPVVLELGGKDPFVVCKDVNMQAVAPTVLRGVFQNAGQNCVGVENCAVEEPVLDEFISTVLPLIQRMTQDVPLKASDEYAVDLGATYMPSQVELIETLVEDAVAKGATLHCGGKRSEKLKPGLFFEPTLISGVTQEMRISKEEVFGPVMTVTSWKTEDELIKRLNASPFGLGSSIFAKDTKRALRISSRMYTGMCNINDFGVNYLVQSLPFGGVKHSGFGRFGGEEGLRACCYEKAVTEDLLPFVSTSLPPPLAYPTSSNAPALAHELIKMGYTDTLFGKLNALIHFLHGLVTAKKN